MEWPTAIALYSAMLSTTLGIIQAYNVLRKPTFVSLIPSFYINEGVVYFDVKLSNRAAQPVLLFGVLFGTFHHNMLGLRTQHDSSIGPAKIEDKEFPVLLKPGESVNVTYKAIDVALNDLQARDFWSREKELVLSQWHSKFKYYVCVEHSQSDREIIKRLPDPPFDEAEIKIMKDTLKNQNAGAVAFEALEQLAVKCKHA